MYCTNSSSVSLPPAMVSQLLASQGEGCSESAIGYYSDIPALAAKVRSSKHWSMGEIFVFAESPTRFIVMKQIVPSSCEMLTITPAGVEDVLTACCYEQDALVDALKGYLQSSSGHPL